jgi:hypothetical protein
MVPAVPALLAALLPPVSALVPPGAEPARAVEPPIGDVPPLPATALGASLLLEHATDAAEVMNRQPIAAEKRDRCVEIEAEGRAMLRAWRSPLANTSRFLLF